MKDVTQGVNFNLLNFQDIQSGIACKSDVYFDLFTSRLVVSQRGFQDLHQHISGRRFLFVLPSETSENLCFFMLSGGIKKEY